MLNTLFNRLHIATGSGDISSLYTEIVNNYNSGKLTQNFANKGIDELYRRKKINWHDFSIDLDYLPAISSTVNIYYKNTVSTNWDDTGNWFSNSACTTPALRIPIDGDTVFIYGVVETCASVDITPVSITLGHSLSSDTFTFSCNLHVLCDIKVYGLCSLTGSMSPLHSVKFYDSSLAGALIANSVYLYNNSSVNSDYAVIDNIFLYNSSIMFNGQFENATFYDSSSIDSDGGLTITTLNGYDSSSFYGSAYILNIYLYNNSHILAGSTFNILYAIFRNYSYVESAYNIDTALFYDNSYRGCVNVTSISYYSSVQDKIFGCTDSLALNYNPLANCGDNSCSYST